MNMIGNKLMSERQMLNNLNTPHAREFKKDYFPSHLSLHGQNYFPSCLCLCTGKTISSHISLCTGKNISPHISVSAQAMGLLQLLGWIFLPVFIASGVSIGICYALSNIYILLIVYLIKIHYIYYALLK